MTSPTQRIVCLETSRSASSKSNIAMPAPLTRLSSPMAIGAIEIPADVTLHALLDRSEVSSKSGAAQIGDLGLREILIGVADRSRRVDIFDFWFAAECGERGRHQIAEAARLTGADIEDSRHRGRLQQPSHDGNRVVDVDEITLLLAIGDARAMRFEQPDRRSGLGLVETLGKEAHHLAFVVLVGAEDVEKFKPGPLRRQSVFARDTLDDGEIEHVLAPAVEVQRLEPLKRR